MKHRQFIISGAAFLVCLAAYLGGPSLLDWTQSAWRESRSPGKHHLVPILCFHNLDGKGVYSISRHRFRRYLETIKQEGIQVVPLKTVLEHSRKNRLFRKPTMAITIDDDFKNIVRVAAPLLREYGYPATLFVYTKDISRSPRGGMSWDDLRRLHAEGFDIQNHSHTHTRFHHPRNEEPMDDYRNRLRKEIEESRTVLQKNIPGLKIYAFAYPMGYYSEYLRNRLFESGHKLLLTVDANPVNISKPFTGTFDRYTIQRKKYIRSPEAMFRLQLSYAKRIYKPEQETVQRSKGRKVEGSGDLTVQ